AVLRGGEMPGAHWFDGAQLNYARQVFRHVEQAEQARLPAIVFRNERAQREGWSLEVSWAELRQHSGAVARALRAMGVGRGDRVAAYLPNIPEATIAFLACA